MMASLSTPLIVVVLITCQGIVGCSRRVPVETLEHFRASILYAQQAIALEPSGKEGSPFITIEEEDFDQIVQLKRLALEEAEQVDSQDLTFLHPDMPRHFEQEFLRGLRQHIVGYDSGDLALMNRRTFLVNDWGDWYSKVQREIAGDLQPQEPTVEGGQNVDEVSQLFETVAQAWTKTSAQQATNCNPNRPSWEVCLEQFKVEVAEGRLALLRHRRLVEYFDEEKLAAFSLLMGDGWTDREEVCTEPLLRLMKDVGATVEFHYYARDSSPLFHHGVGWKQCEELAVLRR